jgi:hypothetical protein
MLRGYTYHLTQGTLDPSTSIGKSTPTEAPQDPAKYCEAKYTDALYLLPVCQSNNRTYKKFEATTLYPLRQASARTSPLPWTIWRPWTKHESDRIAGIKATKSS